MWRTVLLQLWCSESNRLVGVHPIVTRLKSNMATQNDAMLERRYISKPSFLVSILVSRRVGDGWTAILARVFGTVYFKGGRFAHALIINIPTTYTQSLVKTGWQTTMACIPNGPQIPSRGKRTESHPFRGKQMHERIHSILVTLKRPLFANKNSFLIFCKGHGRCLCNLLEGSIIITFRYIAMEPPPFVGMYFPVRKGTTNPLLYFSIHWRVGCSWKLVYKLVYNNLLTGRKQPTYIDIIQ